MKKVIFPIFILLLSVVLIFGCKKDKPEDIPTKRTSQTDQAGSVAVDDGLKDVNDFINNKIGNGSNNARISAYNLPCGVVSVDSIVATDGTKTYKMKYGNQTSCGYKKKSGEVSFYLTNGNSFNQKGAVYSVTFTDYALEVQATGDIVKINGTIQVTNMDGGFIWQAVTESKTIVHKVRGKLQITYSNKEVRERNYFQKRSWSSSSGWTGLSFSVAADTIMYALKISETGKTIHGNYDFKTELLHDFVWSNCGSTYAGPYVLKVGQAKMHVTVPNIQTAFFEVEAGYKYDISSNQAGITKVNDCQSSAYKITSQIGNSSSTQYQLY